MAVFDNFTGDGTTTDFQYTFVLLGSFSAVVVKTRPPTENDFSTLVENTHYSLYKDTKTVSFFTQFTPITGELVRIERFTSRAR